MSNLQSSTPPIYALDARLILGTSTGDSTYWSGLVYGLQQIECNARILLFSRTQKPADLQLTPGFEWVTLPAKSSRWWSLVRFPIAARSMGARAIHTQYSLSPLVGRMGVTTIHDVSFLIGPEWFKPKDRLILSRTVPSSIRRARKVFAVSETCRREIESFIPFAKGKVEVTFNACPPWLHRVDRDVAHLRVSQELGVTGPFMLTVGTRWPRKNMQLAVDAVDLLPDRLAHPLVVTGKAGWGEAGLGQRGRAVGYVANDQLACLYSAAELYLAPSRHEGFGVPLLEAFRCGCPVICSTGGALPEVAADAAIVEPSWAPEDWSKSIVSALDDPSKLAMLRERGTAREKDFSWEQTAQKTLEAYRQVAN